jgi:hypothetical protein
MIAVYYRTNAAIHKSPILFVVPESGLDKDNYAHVTTVKGDPTFEEVFTTMNGEDGTDTLKKLGVRSMMPGDAIVDDFGVLWMCGILGWMKTNWSKV